MSLGVGNNKEQYLIFLCGYLIVFSLLLSFVLTTMNITYIKPIEVPDNMQENMDMFTFASNVFLLFANFLAPIPVPTYILDYSIQIIFLIIPKFGIGVILLSYLKDIIP